MTPSPVKPESQSVSANRVRNSLYTAVRDAVFPPRCAGCRTWNKSLFCENCLPQLRRLRPPLCAQCGKEFDALAHVLEISVCADCRENRYHSAPKLDRRRAPLEYSGPVRQAIHAFKYRGRTALAAPLAALLWEYSQSRSGANISLHEVSVIVPIPLHPLRRWRRGYNQSELLAREFGALAKIPVAEMLRRVRHTQPQIALDAIHRADNVRGAFALNESGAGREYSQLQSVLLMDDVATTGATLEECARVLKTGGVQTVYALTIARRD
jgi:ComF family protein